MMRKREKAKRKMRSKLFTKLASHWLENWKNSTRGWSGPPQDKDEAKTQASEPVQLLLETRYSEDILISLAMFWSALAILTFVQTIWLDKGLQVFITWIKQDGGCIWLENIPVIRIDLHISLNIPDYEGQDLIFTDLLCFASCLFVRCKLWSPVSVYFMNELFNEWE